MVAVVYMTDSIWGIPLAAGFVFMWDTVPEGGRLPIFLGAHLLVHSIWMVLAHLDGAGPSSAGLDVDGGLELELSAITVRFGAGGQTEMVMLARSSAFPRFDDGSLDGLKTLVMNC
ncbi:hypothetical protein ACLOJK_018574 [Asimina triloba]